MEAVSQPVAIFVAQPPNRAPLVALSPEDVGYGKNVDGQNAARESVKFGKDGRYVAMSEEIAVALRKHCGNTINGGDSFFEIPSEAVRHGNALSGVAAASFPIQGLDDEDRKTLSSMEGMAKTSIPPNAIEGVIEKMNWAVEKFRVTNFQVPSADRKLPVIKGRLVELIDILADEDITAE